MKLPPLINLLTSVPVWSLLILHYGSLWSFYFLMNGAPKYMNEVLHFHLGNAGFFASIPYLARFLSSFAFGAAGDWLLKNDKLEKKTIRKSFCIFCELHFLSFELNEKHWTILSPFFSSHFARMFVVQHVLYWKQSVRLCRYNYNRVGFQRRLCVHEFTECTRLGTKLYGHYFRYHQFGGYIVRCDDANGHCLFYS